MRIYQSRTIDNATTTSGSGQRKAARLRARREVPESMHPVSGSDGRLTEGAVTRPRVWPTPASSQASMIGDPAAAQGLAVGEIDQFLLVPGVRSIVAARSRRPAQEVCLMTEFDAARFMTEVFGTWTEADVDARRRDPVRLRRSRQLRRS
jgi:hypothetical protein